MTNLESAVLKNVYGMHISTDFMDEERETN